MVYDPTAPPAEDGPSADELAAIEAEWPLIEAELAVLNAEIQILTATCPSDLDWRRLRRAQARALRAAVALYGRAARSPRLAA